MLWVARCLYAPTTTSLRLPPRTKGRTMTTGRMTITRSSNRNCGSGCGGNDSSSGSHREAAHDGSKKNAVRSTFREDKAPKPSKQSKKKKKPSKHHHHQQSSIMQGTDDLDEEDTSIYLSPPPVPPVQVVAKRLPRPDTPRTPRQKKISQRPPTPGTKKPAASLSF